MPCLVFALPFKGLTEQGKLKTILCIEGETMHGMVFYYQNLSKGDSINGEKVLLVEVEG